MKECRIGHKSIFYEDKVYVFGGNNEVVTHKSCEAYDIKTDTW